MPGVLLCSSGIRHLNEHAGWGLTVYFSASGIGWASLSIVQLPMLACGGREATVMAPPPMHDSAVSPCFHGCRTFLHRHFPPQSPLSPPLDLSLCSQQQPWPRDDSTIPKLQLPAAAPSKGYMAAARTVGFSCHLGRHRSAVPLSALNVSPLTQTSARVWGLDPCFSSPTRRGQVQS